VDHRELPSDHHRHAAADPTDADERLPRLHRLIEDVVDRVAHPTLPRRITVVGEVAPRGQVEVELTAEPCAETVVAIERQVDRMPRAVPPRRPRPDARVRAVRNVVVALLAEPP